MGRRSKPPVVVRCSTDQSATNSSDEYALPSYQPFIDVSNGREGGDHSYTRFYFESPSREDAIRHAQSIRVMVGGRAKGLVRPDAIGDFTKQRVSERFSIELSRLVIRYLHGKHCSQSALRQLNAALKHLVIYLETRLRGRLSELSIFELDFDIWLGFSEYLSTLGFKQPKSIFAKIKTLFASHPKTQMDGEIKVHRKPSSDAAPDVSSTDLLFATDDTYSDSVMYQLLAQFVFRFKSQIEWLKYYQSLNPESLGENWIPPNSQLKQDNQFLVKTEVHKKIESWPRDQIGFRLILDHKLLWFKQGVSDERGFGQVLKSYAINNPILRNFRSEYREWERRTHYIPDGVAIVDIPGLYAKLPSNSEHFGPKNQLGFCLANLVMIYTGVNKEVVLSWPSQKNGKSILDESDDGIFIKSGEEAREVEIVGTKVRTGIFSKKKVVRTPIVIGSPLHDMLREYESHAKVNFEGPFFELTESKKQQWGKDFSRWFAVMDDDGERLLSLSSMKFRKVFASSVLMAHMKGVRTAQELADKMREALDHDDFDVTVNNYLMRSTAATSILDLAIASITSKKITDVLKFEGKVEIGGESDVGKAVYLCQCSNPRKPTHAFQIATECTHYDLCLGCKRSIIFAKHLPYICLRILQYEAARDLVGSGWSAMYEDQWMVAMDALSQYQEKDKKNGVALVRAAWCDARAGAVSLPPIIMTRF